MTNEQITSRCQHCGGSKKEHARKAPFRCPTRVTESYWTPWTVEAYQEAERAAKAAVTVARPRRQEAVAAVAEMPRGFDLTPNFNAMFNGFIRDAKNAGEHLIAGLHIAQFGSGNYPETPEAYARRAAVLRAVQAFVAPATIALQCATSAAEIVRLREVMAETLKHINTWAGEFEAQAPAQEEN